MSVRARIARAWEGYGAEDPYWAILSVDGMQGNRWDLEAFFAAGRADVERELATCLAHGADPPRGRALDFGCGVGRLSQALADHFEEVIGVDVSPAMVRRAEEHDRSAGRCRFVVNTEPDLAFVPDGHVDFVLTLIVLQHMTPQMAAGYMREMVRILSPDGVALIHYTGRRHSRLRRVSAPTRRALMRMLPERVANRAYERLTGRPYPIEMYGMRPDRVRRLLEEAGGEVVAVIGDDGQMELESYRYVVRRASTNRASSSAMRSAARPSP